MKKKILVTLLMAIIICLLIPSVANAADIYLINGETYDLGDASMSDIVHVPTSFTVTLKGIAADGVEIKCDQGVTVNLNNVTTIQSATCPISFTGSGNILNLIGTSTLQSGGGEPGIKVEDPTELTIKGDGTLQATGAFTGAGIGSAQFQNCGTITIESVTIIAIGNVTGAGIGGGHGGNGGTIHVLGGLIEAKSVNGAGIGGGINAPGICINISNGSVTATSISGAGIGGGMAQGGGCINITGGVVYASSNTVIGSQDIGNGTGFSGASADITITNNTSVFLEHEAGGSSTVKAPVPSYQIFNSRDEIPSHYSLLDTWTTFPIGMYGDIIPDPTPTPEATPTPSAGTTPSPSVSVGGDPPQKVENPETGESANSYWWLFLCLLPIILYSKKKRCLEEM